MFGQPQNSPFGGGGGFGQSPAPAFGQSGAFGQSNTGNTFGGGGGGFGAAPAAPFGSPAPAPFGGGGFGANPAPAASSGFGGFGSNTNTSNAFGSNTNTNNAFGGGGGGFGSSTPFGSPAPAPGGIFGSNPAPAPFGQAPAPSGGLFGAPAPAGGGMFGSSTTTFGGGGSAFGGGTNTGFGASPAPAFGSPAPAFGAPAPTTGMFGAPAAATGGGLFGGGAPAAGAPGGGGSKVAPYTATSRQDGTSSIQMQTISAMPAYENKSLEEIRYEDYVQGNKGQGAAGGAPSGFGSFGSPAPAPGGLFGSNPAPAPFGQVGAAPFGAPAPAPGGFGATNTFGKPASGSLFGGGAAPAAGFGNFGAPAPAPPAFGAPAPAPGGLFGSTPTAAPAFGAAPAPAFGSFGAAAPAPAFGAPAPAPAPGGLFGSTSAAAPAFGAAPVPSFGGFGTPAPAPAFGAPGTPSLFGGPAPAPFGAPPAFGAPAPGLFGAPVPAPGGLFGQKAPAPGGFGTFGAPQPAPLGGFGAPAQPVGIFGQQPAAAAPMALPPAGSIIPQAASEVLSHQILALETKRKEMEKLDVWRGKSAEDSSVTPASQPQFEGMSSGAISNSHYSPYRPSPRSTAKIRPRGFGPAITSTTTTSTSPLNNIGTAGRPMMSPDAYAASSVKRLVIKPGTPKPKMRLRLTNGTTNSEAKDPSTETAGSHAPAVAVGSPAAQTNYGSSPSPMKSPTPTGTPYTIPVFGSPKVDQATPSAVRVNANGFSVGKTIASLEKIAPPVDRNLEYYQKVVGSPDGIPPATPSPRAAAQPQSSRKKRPSYLPRLTKPGYVVTPSLEELAVMSEADLATLSGFSIRHDPYGVVEWEGAVDVRNEDLDTAIVIGQSDVSVYTREEEEGRKPPVGSKLNRRATITFFNVFPKNGGASADDETKRKFAMRIEKSTDKMDAELVSYDKDNGVWKIEVQHFSRYGLDDDDSDIEEAPTGAGPQGTPEKQMEEVELWQDEDLGMDDAAIVSDVEMDKENGDEMVFRNAESAFQSLFDSFKSIPDSSPKEEEMEEPVEEEEEEFDDGEVTADQAPPNRVRTSEEDYDRAASAHHSNGICSKIASDVFVSERRAPSNVDYGIRMGRSFRAAWAPDGSFLKLAGGGGTKLQRFRPVFSDPAASDGAGTAYLDAHKCCSRKVPTSVDDGSPRFVLPTAIGNSGDSSSHEALRKTISTFGGKGQEIGNQAFSLLACFVENLDSLEINEPMASLNPEAKGTQFEARRKEGVVRFLVEACRASVEADIDTAMARRDSPSAILAALTGGDIAKACSLAFDTGHEDLSACIATFDSEGCRDIAQQALLATSGSSDTKKLLPIYRLLSGEMGAAGELDWKRAILVRMLYGKSRNAERGLPQVLQAYSRDVAASAAPYPLPDYAIASKSTVECILYRLLRLAEQPQSVSLTEIVAPSGASRYSHDFALAFHLACCGSAAGVSGPMSPSEESHLIDGYCAQLCLSGRWEWAVYVCLCSLNPDMIESSSTDWKRNKAKEIVLRSFDRDSKSESKIIFLEHDVGVPKEWLYEALAMRQGKSGDPFQYIGNLAAYSPSEASAVAEDIFLPNLLFMSPQDLQRSLTLLASFERELSPLSTAVLNLFEISKDLHSLMLAPHGKALEHVPALSDDLREIETTLQAHQSTCEKMQDGVGLKFCPSFDTIPMPSMLHEALEHCLFLKLQLKAVEMGIELDGEISTKRLTSLLAFHTVDGYDDKWGTREVLRALR